MRLLISEPERKPLSVLLQMLKQIASHKLGRRDHPRFLQTRYYDFPVCSFVHHATGVEGIVEIESEWTARKREQFGIPQ